MPELYNVRSDEGAIGSYQGSIPTVGDGAGAAMMAMLDRGERLMELECVEPDADTDADLDVEPDDADLDAGPERPDAEGGRLRMGCGCAAVGRRWPPEGNSALIPVALMPW
jgi:hypothetical protein